MSPGLWFGGDYNPEQWDEAVWAEDGRLMREAGVNTATVGVFSWALLEPEEGRYDFGWLDATLDRLHRGGVQVILATPTASPPPWFTLAHPDAMPVTRDGVRLSHGSRDTYCAAAPAYRTAARRIAAALAARYAGHPALALWHVHNEYGTVCWCEHAATAFRNWLQRRYGPAADGLRALNEAWGTAFWGQRYTAWEQVLPPRATQWLGNPSQLLDFRRFWSGELLAAFCEQRDAIREHAPGTPVTTNFILPDYQVIDPWAWSREVDVVAVDHYLSSAGRGRARRHRVRRRPGPVLGGRAALAADGAGHPAGLRRRPDPQPGAGPDARRQPGLPGPGLGQRAVLPVAGVPRWGGDVPLRDGAARRAGLRRVPGGRGARRGGAAAGRGGRLHGHRAGRGAAGRRLVVGAGSPRAARRGHQLPG